MTDLWWKSAVVYQIYPRSFADADGDGMGDLRGIIDHLDHLAGLGVDVLWLSPIYPSPQDDNGYDISDYQDIDPLFGDLADLRRAARGRARARHEADHGPGGEPQLGRAPVVRREPLVEGQPEARLVLVAAGPRGHGAGHARRRADQLGRRVRRARPGSTTRPPASTTCTCSRRKQPDLNWENPEVREAVYAMMRWWLDRGVDGFRMDVINMISKRPGRSLPDGRLPAGAAYADGSAALHQRAADPRVPAGDARARSSPAGTRC